VIALAMLCIDAHIEQDNYELADMWYTARYLRVAYS
jgi:hypothetical protein